MARAFWNENTGEWEYPWENPDPDLPSEEIELPVAIHLPQEPTSGTMPVDGGHVVTPAGPDRPPKPDDPGDGRVWIWMGDQWGLTQPINAPFAPSSGGPGPGGLPSYQPPVRTPLGALNYPAFNAPQFAAPSPFAFDQFAYEDFKAPTIAEAQAEPGFEYALNQGLKAYENSRAYLGTYKSGSTIKGLNDYARNMASQNYNQVFERQGQTYDRNRANAFGTYQANRGNAADAYATNYGISRDVFDRNYQGAKDTYAGRAREAELNFAREWDQYAYEGDDAYRRWLALVNANST